MKLTQSLFLVFEGPDGAGKTTQAKRLVARLESEWVPVTHVREPGGTPVGEAIREILLGGADRAPMPPEAELLLFVAARKALIEQRIRPALCGESPRVVVCDRFNASTLAYQGGGRGLAVTAVFDVLAAAGCLRDPDPRLTPHRTIFLDATYEQAVSRRTASRRAADRMEPGKAFHDRVRRAYQDLATGTDIVFPPDSTPDQIAASVWDRVATLPHFTD